MPRAGPTPPPPTASMRFPDAEHGMLILQALRAAAAAECPDEIQDPGDAAVPMGPMPCEGDGDVSAGCCAWVPC